MVGLGAQHRRGKNDRLGGYAGFVFRHDQRGFIVGAPHPVFCLLLASPLGFRLARRGRRRATGLCPNCGYDLRATPERCPECGATPDKVTAPV